MLTRSVGSTPSSTRRWRLSGLFWPAFLMALALLLPGCVSTQVRTATDTGGQPIGIDGSVVLVEPDIELSEVLAGGAQEPRQAWTEAARRFNLPLRSAAPVT